MGARRGHREDARWQLRERRLGHEALDDEKDDGGAERPHVFFIERGLDADELRGRLRLLLLARQSGRSKRQARVQYS